MKNKTLIILIAITSFLLVACSASSSSPIGISCNPPNPANACYGG